MCKEGIIGVWIHGAIRHQGRAVIVKVSVGVRVKVVVGLVVVGRVSILYLGMWIMMRRWGGTMM